MPATEQELAPGAPIVLLMDDGRPRLERVFCVKDGRVYAGAGPGRGWWVTLAREGETWCLGWDTPEALAFRATVLLQASA